jgi:hypothetical protein
MTGWVCEQHPQEPWEGEHACGYGAAGIPYSLCKVPEDGKEPRMPRALRARWLAPLSWLDQFEDAVPACHASECCELHPAATERRATNPASASACPSASPCDQNTRARRRDASSATSRRWRCELQTILQPLSSTLARTPRPIPSWSAFVERFHSQMVFPHQHWRIK